MQIRPLVAAPSAGAKGLFARRRQKRNHGCGRDGSPVVGGDNEEIWNFPLGGARLGQIRPLTPEPGTLRRWSMRLSSLDQLRAVRLDAGGLGSRRAGLATRARENPERARRTAMLWSLKVR